MDLQYGGGIFYTRWGNTLDMTSDGLEELTKCDFAEKSGKGGQAKCQAYTDFERESPSA